MRVAILGNMNNNGFSLLRYLIREGICTHLYLFSNDGVGELARFSTESDTWNEAEWKAHISRTNVADTAFSGLHPFVRVVLLPFVIVFQTLARRTRETFFTKRQIKKILEEHDVVIGSGIAPALTSVYRTKPLDIFFPYSIGIEHWGASVFAGSIWRRSKSLVVGKLGTHILKNQINGITRAHRVVSSDSPQTRELLSSIGQEGVGLIFPMVYRDSRPQSGPPTEVVQEFEVWSQEKSITIVSFARQEWRGKRNFLALEAFAKLRALHGPHLGLALSESGPDWGKARLFMEDHGLEEEVLWIPNCGRREVLEILKLADVALGEFYAEPGLMMGGTAWEALSAGTPFINGFTLGPNEFRKVSGLEPPPILPANSTEEIFVRLHELTLNRAYRWTKAQEARAWFDNEIETKLVQKWISLLEEVSELNKQENSVG